jgi:hypothetical protein
MKNQEIFNDYDMVVCMTRKTINDQLTHLTRLGVIRSELVLVQKVVGREYVYQVLESVNDVPKDADGNPTVSYIDGHITPQVEIAESGTNITFVLSFRSGSAWFWEGNGPMATLTQYDMTGWKYGISITLDLKAVEADALKDNKTVPDIAKETLYHFMSNMFTVNSLFMDFESTDLMRFDPANSAAPSGGDVGLQQLVLFMNFYLKDLKNSGNPYILGYSVTANDQSTYDPDQNVPDALRPVGSTFTLYHDPQSPDLSNLNFVLATKDGHGSIIGTPGNLDSNWITPAEQCDAKMIYSHERLMEQFVVKPFFDQLSTSVYTQIKDHIDVSQNRNYADARSVTGTGLAFSISDVSSGDNQYVNHFSADYATADQAVTVTLNGHLAFYKGVNKNMGFCTANAHAIGSLDWSCTITLATAKNDKGEPTLGISASDARISNSTSDSGKNDCAKAFEEIGKIVGGVLDALTFFSDKGFFSNLLDGVMGLPVPGIGNLGTAFGNLTNSVSTVLVLPAGQVFFFKVPGIDADGNLSMQLTYKTES